MQRAFSPRTKESNHRDVLRETPAEEGRGDIIDMIVIGLRIADEDLQETVPLSRHLQREDDHDGEGREQLDRCELARRA